MSDSNLYFVVQVPRIDIDDVTSKLLHCAWAGALEAAKEFADLDDPLVTWLRKGDDELRKLAVAIAIDVYTTLRVLNSNFKIPPATSPIIGYLAIASWMVFAFHRRAALDDSMRARPSGKRGATDVIGEERVLRPRSQGSPITCMKIVMAYLLVQCHDDEISELDTQQLRVFLKTARSLNTWGMVQQVIYLLHLGARFGVVRAVHVRSGTSVEHVLVGHHGFVIKPIRYGAGGTATAPKAL